MKAGSPPMKTWQKIMAWTIIPLYIIDYSITIYFTNYKGLGLEAEGNPLILFFWNHLGQTLTFFLFLTTLIVGMALVIKWWKHMNKTKRTIMMIGITIGIIFRVVAITGWLQIGGII